MPETRSKVKVGGRGKDDNDGPEKERPTHPTIKSSTPYPVLTHLTAFLYSKAKSMIELKDTSLVIHHSLLLAFSPLCWHSVHS